MPNRPASTAPKSRGPVTEKGKSISSQNRIRHGLLGRTIVLKGESHHRFSTLLESLLSPVPARRPVETALVNTLAACSWRRMRLWTLEKVAITHEVDNSAGAPDAPTQVALAWRSLSDSGRSLDLLSRYEGRLDAQ